MFIQQLIRFEGRADELLDGVLRGTIKGKDVLVAKSGIGGEKTIMAIGSWLDEYPISSIISTGVAGALLPDLVTGDIVIGEKVLSQRGEVLFSDRNLIDVCIKSCNGLGMRYFLDTILTSSDFVASKNEKMKLYSEYKAIAVEMESAFIAKYAVEQGIPFLVVRVISDRATTSFNVDFQRTKKGGKLDPWKSFAYFSIHPMLYLEFRRHRKRLAMAVSHLPPLIGEIIEQLN